MSRDETYLRHVIECIERINANVASGYGAFLESHTLQDAVLRNLQTLAESTRRLSDEVKEEHPEIPWREIGRFRNVIVHDYLGIDLAAVWTIIHRDVPQLEQVVRRMLTDLEQS